MPNSSSDTGTPDPGGTNTTPQVAQATIRFSSKSVTPVNPRNDPDGINASPEQTPIIASSSNGNVTPAQNNHGPGVSQATSDRFNGYVTPRRSPWQQPLAGVSDGQIFGFVHYDDWPRLAAQRGITWATAPLPFRRPADWNSYVAVAWVCSCARRNAMTQQVCLGCGEEEMTEDSHTINYWRMACGTVGRPVKFREQLTGPGGWDFHREREESGPGWLIYW
ncbi:hypothetical protein QBC38DRAFT_138710 [Podospora fimiseda]|uniref:Uncharacterized protein n=1 Tax=Podospora fimiseda TaxID=252190 RepID=A0AAN6YRQ5_9PEZI|nr:hypothetical protein QBC38DRAFT_138710 [Podospora fimiseda]